MERTRYVDVGARIGRAKAKSNVSVQQFTFEEQERRLNARADGDLHLNQCNRLLTDASEEASFDQIPFLPGCWTSQLHAKVVHLLDLAQEQYRQAETFFRSADAKDKV